MTQMQEMNVAAAMTTARRETNPLDLNISKTISYRERKQELFSL